MSYLTRINTVCHALVFELSIYIAWTKLFGKCWRCKFCPANLELTGVSLAVLPARNQSYSSLQGVNGRSSLQGVKGLINYHIQPAQVHITTSDNKVRY